MVKNNQIHIKIVFLKMCQSSKKNCFVELRLQIINLKINNLM